MLYTVVCFDAKINFDDNAKFRQEDLFASEDISEKNPREVEAEKYNLNYIGMDGNIACIGKTIRDFFYTLTLCTNIYRRNNILYKLISTQEPPHWYKKPFVMV